MGLITSGSGIDIGNYPSTVPPDREFRYGVDPTYYAAAGALSCGYGGSPGCWGRQLDPLNLQPGDYTITGWSGILNFTQAVDLGQFVLAVWTKVGTTWTPVWAKDATVAVQAHGLPQNYQESLSPADLDASTNLAGSGRTFTVTSAGGTSWFIGICMKRTVGAGAGKPGWRLMAVGPPIKGPVDSYAWYDTAADTQAFGAFDSSVAPYVPKQTSYAAGLFQLAATTKNRIVFDTGAGFYSGVTKKVMVPKFTDTYFMVSETVEAAAGQTVAIEGCDQVNADKSVKVTTVLNPEAGNEKVTFQGADVALDGTEATNHFDIVTNFRPVDNRVQCIYQNKTHGKGPQSTLAGSWRDIIPICHEAKRTATRHPPGLALTEEPAWIEVSGTGSLGRVVVAQDVFVMLGDSQSGSKNGADLDAYLQRVGTAIPATFSYKPYVFNMAILGRALCTPSANLVSAGKWSYKADVVGQGDGCEFRGATFVVLLGVNDMSGLMNSMTRNEAVTQFVDDAAAVVHDMVEHGNRVIIIGLPVWYASREPPISNEEKFQAIGQLDRALHGLAQAARCCFYSPYRLTRLHPDYINPMPDGVHFSNPGALAACAELAIIHDSGSSNTLLRQ